MTMCDRARVQKNTRAPSGSGSRDAGLRREFRGVDPSGLRSGLGPALTRRGADVGAPLEPPQLADRPDRMSFVDEFEVMRGESDGEGDELEAALFSAFSRRDPARSAPNPLAQSAAAWAPEPRTVVGARLGGEDALAFA